jgi:hypothetical protein
MNETQRLTLEEFDQQVNPVGYNFFNTVRYIQHHLHLHDWKEDAGVIDFYFQFVFRNDTNFKLKGASYILFCKIFKNLLAKELTESEGISAREANLAREFFEEVVRKHEASWIDESDTDLQFKIGFDVGALEWKFVAHGRNWGSSVRVGVE